MPPQQQESPVREITDSDSSSDFESFDEYDGDDAQKQRNAATLAKDSDEEDLEKLVLGDFSGFRANLQDGLGATYDDSGNMILRGEDDDDDGELEEVADTDLFMFDTGVAGEKGSTTKTAAQDANAPVWVDSDDEKLAVSLASATRLRKLRIAEDEDLVSGTEYCKRLRQQFLRLNPAPSWARYADGRPSKKQRRTSGAAGSSSDSSDASDDDGDLTTQPMAKFLRDINRLTGRDSVKNRRLRPEVLDIQRTREIPDKHKAPVVCLSFHPEYPVLLSASTSSILYLHHVAPDAQPTPNPRLTSVQVKQVDVRRAEFVYPAGDKIIFGGRRRYFHTWDLPSGSVAKTSQIQGHRLEHKTMERFKTSPCGRYMGIVASSRKGGGVINVLSVASMQWIAAARMSSRHGVADFAWWSNGEGMTILGKDGSVGEYSMDSRTFLGVWQDDGCIGCIVVALGGHNGPTEIGEDRWVAVGSNSGITNIYDRYELLAGKAAADAKTTMEDGEKTPLLKERPTPRRAFDQLVTPVTEAVFSPDGQLFAFGSREKKDALRMVHVESCTVYRNWPTRETPLGRITSVAFSRQSDMLAVGNDAGKIRLWEIRS